MLKCKNEIQGHKLTLEKRGHVTYKCDMRSSHIIFWDDSTEMKQGK
jgi:hypothetical protein